MSLADLIQNTRDEAISICYNAAVEQIKSFVHNNPFQTTFTVTAGCISAEMSTEIAKRFNIGGVVKAIVQQGGVVSCSHSILLTCPLYEDL